MISQAVSSIFPCSPLPSVTWWTPGLSIPWCCLPTCSSVCLIFFPLSLCLARWFWQDLMNGRHVHTTDCSLRLFTMVRRSLCGPIAWDFLVGNMVFVRDAQYLALASHFHGLYSSLEFCWEGPWFTSIQKMDVTRQRISRILKQRNTPVIPNWFQPCQCCCCLCYPGNMSGTGTLTSYNWAQILEACNCFKLLSVYFDLLVESAGVVCHRIGLLGIAFHAVGCGGLVETFNQFCQYFLLCGFKQTAVALSVWGISSFPCF